MPQSTMRRARSTASSRVSSSVHAAPGPDSSQQAMQRALQRLVENPLALRLLEGDFVEGNTIRVDASDGEIVFEKTGTVPAAA